MLGREGKVDSLKRARHLSSCTLGGFLIRTTDRFRLQADPGAVRTAEPSTRRRLSVPRDRQPGRAGSVVGNVAAAGTRPG